MNWVAGKYFVKQEVRTKIVRNIKFVNIKFVFHKNSKTQRQHFIKVVILKVPKHEDSN